MSRPEQRVAPGIWRRADGSLVSPINTMLDAAVTDVLKQIAFFQRRSSTSVLESAILAYAEQCKLPLVKREMPSDTSDTIAGAGR